MEDWATKRKASTAQGPSRLRELQWGSYASDFNGSFVLN